MSVCFGGGLFFPGSNLISDTTWRRGIGTERSIKSDGMFHYLSAGGDEYNADNRLSNIT